MDINDLRAALRDRGPVADIASSLMRSVGEVAAKAAELTREKPLRPV